MFVVGLLLSLISHDLLTKADVMLRLEDKIIGRRASLDRGLRIGLLSSV
jgi:hypothetical protein